MPDPIIRRTLLCSVCRYDLEGLSARGNCPECGHDIVASLAARLDLGATQALEFPGARRMAWALTLAAVGALAGTGILATAVFEFISIRANAPTSATILINVLRSGPTVALVGASIGFVAMLGVLPWTNRDGMLRCRVLGTLGFTLWIVAALEQPSLGWMLGATGAAAIALIAIAPLFKQLGPLSRVYRSRQTAAQPFNALLLALFGAGSCGGLANGLPSLRKITPALADTIELASTVLWLTATACAATLVFGLLYLVVNAVWILCAVMRPAPDADSILGSDEHDE